MAASMELKSAKRVGIVGAGTSGLAACKHLLARGFRPVVFEAGTSIGGLWTRTLASTRLQSPNIVYRFSDFPWAEGVDLYPRHDQVVDYLAAYARRFGVDECVRFRSRVVAAEYVGADGLADAEQWAGNGEAFGRDGAGVWRLTVQHGDADANATQIYEFDFLILCIGRFSGVPNIPSFPPSKGPDVFHGRVIHSMEFSNMDDADAAALVKGKRVAIVGSGKSALDIAAECAEANGAELPCSVICRSPQWLVHDTNVWGKVNIAFLYMNRLAELMVRRPGASVASILLAILLTPLAWLISKLTEAYYKKALPLREHGMEPDFGFAGGVSACMIGMLPEGFYDKVKDGSIVTRRSRSFSFCEDGLVLEEGAADDRRVVVVPADLVILATGFQGDQKLRDMFVSPQVKEIVAGSSDTTVPLYRECVHPRIRQMAVIGYSESLANIFTCEMMAKWVARFLDGAFRLPSVRRMEQSAAEWGRYMRRSSRDRFRKSCLGGVNIWYNDQLCRDMGCNPRRKEGLIAEWLVPYGAVDYADIQ